MEEKTADEIFEELGYEQVKYGKSKILYRKELDFEGFCTKSAWFDKTKKIVELDGYYTAKELQAINKKCEELGWKKWKWKKIK